MINLESPVTLADLVTPVRPGDPYVRLGDVLDFHRAHFPGDPRRYSASRQERGGAEDCQVILPEDIRPFCPSGRGMWTDYGEILREFGRLWSCGKYLRQRPYRYKTIFSPAKLVLAESDRPIRAFLTHDPVYPTRGKLATVRTPWSLTSAYVAVGILNSSIGLFYYHKLYQDARGRPSQGDSGLLKQVLKQIPLYHRGCAPEHLAQVAELSFRLGMLCAAEQDCNEDYSSHAEHLRTVLLSYASRVLRLADGEPDRMIDTVRDFHPYDAPDPQLTLDGSLRTLPPLDRINLLEREERRQYDELISRRTRKRLRPEDAAPLVRLERQVEWELRINGESAERGARGLGRETPSARADGHLSARESELLQKINLGLDDSIWTKYHQLREKLREATLTPEEHRELMGISDQIEAMNTRRIEHLVELAGLRKKSLREVMDELGLTPAPFE